VVVGRHRRGQGSGTGVGAGGAAARAIIGASSAATWAGVVYVCGPVARCALDKVPYLRQLKQAVVDKVLCTWSRVDHGPS
jgi:hypothetical protein